MKSSKEVEIDAQKERISHLEGVIDPCLIPPVVSPSPKATVSGSVVDTPH